MSSATRHVHYSYAEYLALEDLSPIRHEYFDGEIYAMAGGPPEHAALAAALIQQIGARLPPGCRAFTSDLRIRIEATGLSTYPDASFVCGKTQRAADDPLAVTNPVLIVEVTSPSTEEYDRGERLRNYQALPSVREIVIASHRERRLTIVRRGDAGLWTTSEGRAGEALTLESAGGAIAVDDVYRGGLEDTGAAV
jgi:Uma2 family endonuclease